MVTSPPAPNRSQLATHIRQRLVDEAVESMAALIGLVELHLTTLLKDFATAPDQKLLLETWTLYQNQDRNWLEGTSRAWRAAFKSDVPPSTGLPLSGTLELVSTETVENQILSSRIALSMMEVAASEVNDLRKRLKSLRPHQELSAQDIVHPEVLALAMVEQWARCGFSLASWQLINTVVQHHINARWRHIYARCNAELVEQGVMPVIAPEERAKAKPVAAAEAPTAEEGQQGYAPGAHARQARGTVATSGGGVPGRSGQGSSGYVARRAPAWPVLTKGASYQSDARETGVLDRVGRLLTDMAPLQNYPPAFQYAPSEPLMTALARRPALGN